MKMVNFADRLKNLRLEKRFDQATLAKRLGCSKSLICCYENGTRLPSIDMLIKYAYEFKVSVDYLLGIDKQKSLKLYDLTSEQITIVSNIIDEYVKLNNK